MHDWIILGDRMGRDTPSPTKPQMMTVLEELFSSDRDDEHPDCSLRCGSDNGPLCVASVFQSGRAEYEKFSDQDMSVSIARKEIPVRNPSEALIVWEALIAGRL